MGLFNFGDFCLHSGRVSDFKIDCDAMTDEDVRALAAVIRKRLPSFRAVVGIPRGGLRFAKALRPFATGRDADPVLIVDDVCTTGESLEAAWEEFLGEPVVGAVLFARRHLPWWAMAVFVMEDDR